MKVLYSVIAPVLTHKVTSCEDTNSTHDTDDSKIMIERSLCNRANAKSADGEKITSDSGSCQEEHGVQAEDGESSRECDGIEISLQEVIPVSCHQISKLESYHLWPLSMTKVL